MSTFGNPNHLAPEQLRFAESMQATASVGGANEYGMVFTYREGPHGTERWLVDRRGRVVDHVRFTTQSGPSAARPWAGHTRQPAPTATPAGPCLSAHAA